MKKLLKILKQISQDSGLSSWKLEYKGFKAVQEGLRESLCALGNGYFGVRSAATEVEVSKVHYPGMYIAGVYNKLATIISGRTIYNEDFVNCPNCLPLTFKVGEGDWFHPSTSGIIDSYQQELNLRIGVLSRKISLRQRNKKFLIKTQRIAHMQNPHYLAIKYAITPKNYEGPITVRVGLDGRVKNTGVLRYRDLNNSHLKAEKLGKFSDNCIYLLMQTNQSKITIAQAAKTRIFCGNKEIKPKKITTVIKGKRSVWQEFSFYLKPQNTYTIEKVVTIYTSRDYGVRAPLLRAISLAKRAKRFDDLFKTHIHAWLKLWDKFDIQIEGDFFAQKVLRLHIFHLLQTASSHNKYIDAGLPARGLVGEAYRGHIFWDSFFVMHFYNFHQPEITRALILYRYRRITQARKDAKNNGYQGAMFPWQSGSTGQEETQVIHLNPLSGKWGPDYSCLQRHVSFAIAHNVWMYWQRTQDKDFLANYGAEMLLSIAQFAASLVRFSKKDKRYHTEKIMGPDEFHEKVPGKADVGVKDNAYTNILIVWTLLKAEKILKVLSYEQKKRIFRKIGFKSEDLRFWQDITKRMEIVINKEGVIGQFDGYFQLKELSWPDYREKYGNIQRMDRILKAEGKSPNAYKVSKQADVLMIFYLFSLTEIKGIFRRLGYNMNLDVLRKNYDYYIQRTSHGSTLSKVTHCYLAHRLGKRKEAEELFLEVLKSDIYDTQGGTTPEGIHLGVMGGSIDIVMRAFAGIRIFHEQIKIDPQLPKRWKSIRLKFCYRNIWVSVSVTCKNVTICLQKVMPSSPIIPIEIYGNQYYFRFGKIYRIHKKDRQN